MIKCLLTNINKPIVLEKETSLLEISKQLDNNKYVCAKVDKRLRELSYIVKDDCEIEFLDLTRRSAQRIYEASLRYLISKALYNLYPEAQISYNYHVSQSILGIVRKLPRPLDQEILDNIKKEVLRLIKLDIPFKRTIMSLDDIERIYQKQNMFDKIAVLNFREVEYVNTYECDKYFNYMYSLMVPSTGYLDKFNFILYGAGFLIQYPRSNEGGIIPEFVEEEKFAEALKNAARWVKLTKASDIEKMNKIALSHNDTVDFVSLCETKHSNELYQLGTKIIENRNDIRLIGIAGPSSSGKTTFAKRLRIELMSRGLNPELISIDDFYLDKNLVPKDKNGDYDLEHIEALDINLFNDTLSKLIKGEEVTLPKYNFKTSKRENGKTIKIDKDQPIIIEGIHALNDRLTSKIPRQTKFKIYIGPQTQTHIDNHNPISFTDLRLLRRIVRDSKYRNAPATETMFMWPSVREGEFKWIYPHQRDVDFVFNTELTYEFNVLKKHALPMLQAVPRDSEYFITANRLVKFLKYFVDIPDHLVPCNSLLREFIGGSCFE